MQDKIVEYYLSGMKCQEIMELTGIKSDQTIYNRLAKAGITHRKNTRANTIDKAIVFSCWRDNIEETTRSIAVKNGCSPPTIRSIILEFISKSEMTKIKNEKISHSTKLRPDLKTDKHREQCKRASKIARDSISDERKREIILKMVQVSADSRKGKPLSAEHKAKFKNRPIRKGEFSSNWKGGVSKKQSRAPFWEKAQKACRNRDNHICQSCGTTTEKVGQLLDVHHIVSYHSFEDKAEANKLTNLISLCRICHLRIEQSVIPCPTIK